MATVTLRHTDGTASGKKNSEITDVATEKGAIDALSMLSCASPVYTLIRSGAGFGRHVRVQMLTEGHVWTFVRTGTVLSVMTARQRIRAYVDAINRQLSR